jgi:hypothetical protein
MEMKHELDRLAQGEMEQAVGLCVWIARLAAFLAGVALAMCLAGCKNIPWEMIPTPDKPPEQSADAVAFESLRPSSKSNRLRTPNHPPENGTSPVSPGSGNWVNFCSKRVIIR